MRPRIRTQKRIIEHCTTSKGGNARILTSSENGVKRRVKTMTDHMEELKSQLRKAISNEKYAIKEVGGQRVIYILTRNGYFGQSQGIFC